MRGGGDWESIEELEGVGERSGEAWASQPLLPPGSETSRSRVLRRGCREMPASSSSSRRYGSSFSSSSEMYASRTVCLLICSLARRCGSSRSSRSASCGLPARDPPSEVNEKNSG